MAEARLTVEEASDAYANAMRNPAAPGPGVCPICWTFYDPGFPRCYACSQQPDNLDVLAPITYSVDSGQMHAALRGYKDDLDPQARYFHAVRLTAILWRFIQRHERCIAAAGGVERFNLVTVVPSKTREWDEVRSHLRTMVGSWCRPISDRFQRVLTPSDRPAREHAYQEDLYVADDAVAGRDVLLIDDTWTTGGVMQSAAHALREAGACSVAGLAIGRHLRLDFGWEAGDTLERYRELSNRFDWGICAVNRTS